MTRYTKRQQNIRRRRTHKKQQIGGLGALYGLIGTGVAIAGSLALRYLFGGAKKSNQINNAQKPLPSLANQYQAEIRAKKMLHLKKKKLIILKMKAKRKASRLEGVCETAAPIESSKVIPKAYFCRAYTDNEIDFIARSCATTVKTIVSELITGSTINNVVNAGSESVFVYMYNHIIKNPIQGGTRKLRMVGGEIDTPEKIGEVASKMALVTARGDNSVNIKQDILKLGKKYNIDTDSSKILANVAVA